ncbi:MAG: hypothetical protein GY868_18330 [Deltaproteobacteria bacterium]|nr:hypothetical protein [Deltaproteobacteria bacterium]
MPVDTLLMTGMSVSGSLSFLRSCCVSAPQLLRSSKGHYEKIQVSTLYYLQGGIGLWMRSMPWSNVGS